MTRERVFLFIALPIIGFAVLLLWKEYGEYYGKSPAANFPDASQVTSAALSGGSSAKTAPARGVNPDRGVAIEKLPKRRGAEENSIIGRAKNTIASTLDTSLPSQPIGTWIAHAAGASAQVAWEVNSCGDIAKEPGTTPVCAQATIDFSDGTKFETLLLMGSRQLKSRQIQYSNPSLLWAVYAKGGSDVLTPAPLDSLVRVAQEAD